MEPLPAQPCLLPAPCSPSLVATQISVASKCTKKVRTALDLIIFSIPEIPHRGLRPETWSWERGYQCFFTLLCKTSSTEELVQDRFKPELNVTDYPWLDGELADPFSKKAIPSVDPRLNERWSLSWQDQKDPGNPFGLLDSGTLKVTIR
jgi:hypothetical protein